MPKRSLRFGMCRHVIEGARLFSHIYYSAKIARKVPRQDAIILPIPRFWPAIALDLGAQPGKQWSERTTEDTFDTASALLTLCSWLWHSYSVTISRLCHYVGRFCTH